MNRPNEGKPTAPRNPQGTRNANNLNNGNRLSSPNGQPIRSASNTSPNNARPVNEQKQNADNQRRGAQPQRGALGAQKPSKSSGKRRLLKAQKKQKASAKSPNKKPTRNSQIPKQSSEKNINTQSPRPQINQKASAAAARAMNTKHSAPAGHKYRGGSYILYYLLAIFVVAIVLIILANTVLFNCKDIEVCGAERYLPENIVEVSRIRKGDNLLHIDTDKAAERIVAELAYIDAAQVETSFPTKIIITVTEAEKWYCINQYGVNAIISRGGKILEKGLPADLPVVTGYEAESLETGARLSSKAEGKEKIPEQILNAADKAGVTDIDSIDITDRYSIKMVVDGRITIELGAITDIETKLLVAHKLIEDKLSPSENVTVLLSNPEKVAVHTNRPAEPVDPNQSDQTSNNPEINSSDS